MGERTTYAVQWQVDGRPTWKFYSNWVTELAQAQKQLAAAMQYNGCMQARILARTETLRVAETKKWEDRLGKAQNETAGG